MKTIPVNMYAHSTVSVDYYLIRMLNTKSETLWDFKQKLVFQRIQNFEYIQSIC